MSLALFAAIVIRLETDRHVSVPRLATWLAVDEARVRAVLHDVYLQGHCTLWTDTAGTIVGAAWKAQAVCA